MSLKKYSIVLSFAFLLILSCGGTTQKTQKPQVNTDTVINAFNPALEPGTQIGLLVSFETGDELKYYFNFNAQEVDALTVLQASILKLEILHNEVFGDGVCKIGNTGQNADACYADEKGRYWALFSLSFGQNNWIVSPVGPQGLLLQDGDVVAYLWTGSDPITFDPLRVPTSTNIEEYFKK